MPDIILHHYRLSTFSEKVRLALGLKDMTYREVIVPPTMPKPDLLPLTGGYRRAPVMQIGADIFCDTLLILREIERLQPEPTLWPDGCEGQATAVAWWAERYVFMPALGFIANVNDDLYDANFVEERRKFGFLLGKADVGPLFDHYVQQLVGNMGVLIDMLKDGRPFLFGDRPSGADFAAYPAIWFLHKWGGAETGRRLPVARLQPWVERIAAIGYGRATEITGAEALDAARDAVPQLLREPEDRDPTGLRLGTRVTVTATDVGRDPVAGVLVSADEQEVVIRTGNEARGRIERAFPEAVSGLRRRGSRLTALGHQGWRIG